MNESRRDIDEDHLEPTIVPVRRPVSPDADGRAAGRQGTWRFPVFGLLTLLCVAGVVAVFFYLPAWVEQSQPAPAPEPAVAAEPEDAAPALTEEERAALESQAESLLAELLEQQQDLAARSAASWGDTTWTSYESAARLADEAFLAGDLAEAVRGYEAALETGTGLLARSESIVDEALAAGVAALDGGNAELAASQFALVLEIDADNDRALRGAARAEVLPDVLDAMRRGDALEADGDLEAAADVYRAALGIDPDHAAARRALDSVRQRIAEAQFDRLITEGYAAIDERRFDLAAERFEAALAMRPGSQAAADGLVQAEQGIELSAIAMAEVRGMAFERRERWEDAIERYREALATDPTLAFAIEGLERAQQRLDLDVKLEALIESPRLLLTDEVLQDARRLLDQARAIESPGPRLSSQTEQLDRLVDLASTPIPVTLVSDNATEVTLYRVGDLGTFGSKEIALKPGSYTAVGQRRGYRDVRASFTVLPGAENGPVTVICVDEI